MSDPHDLTAATKFALRLETSCRAFETLRAIIKGSLVLIDAQGEQQLQATAAIRMALAQEFIANAARARRVLDTAKAEIPISKEARKSFLSETASVVDVRDVNEHGLDNRHVKSKPTMHDHGEGSVDEFSLAVFGPDQILMGSLNLVDVYTVVAEMRDLAGFQALSKWDVG